MSEDSSPNWIDDQLRQVRLPDGLLERLRRAGTISDEDLDQALAEVPLPPQLIERLSAIVDDEALDVRLCEVPIPDDLLDDLLSIPYEEQLRDVPVPVDLMPALRRIPPRPRRRLPAAQLALAASLLVMITAGYLLSVTGMVLTAYDPYAGGAVDVISVDAQGVDLVSSSDDELAVPISLAGWPLENDDSEVVLADGGDVLNRHVDTVSIPSQIDQWLGPRHTLIDSTLPIKYRFLGYLDDTADRTPTLEMLEGPLPRGVEPPIALGFDRQALITTRTQPIVRFDRIEQLAAASPDLDAAKLLDQIRHTGLPLWTRTASFDRARRLAGQRRLPPAHEIHVEDYIAAMDFQYPPPEDEPLGLRVYAGPSHFGEEGAQLLQVGVQSRAARTASTARHVTFVVDYSQSMEWSGRWDMVREGLCRAAKHLSEGDRISLVVFNDEAFAMLEQTPAGGQPLLQASLDDLTPRGATNIGAALQQAAQLTLSATLPPDAKQHIVLISDGAPLAGDDAPMMRALLTEMTAGGATLDVMDVSTSVEGSAGLRQLAEMAGGKPHVVNDADALYFRLADRLTGQSPVVAEEAMLQVSFNPKAVRAYRLLGHEKTTLGGMQPAQTQSTLTAGQAGTAVYEVWLYPNSEDRVADVEVSWRIPGSEKEHIARQQVRRVQFLPSLAEAALQLQAATIAAEAAEVLRQSPFAAGRPRDLSGVLELAGQVNPRLAKREAFARYVRVLEQIEAARRGAAE